MTLSVLGWLAAALAWLPLAMTLRNLPRFRRLQPASAVDKDASLRPLAAEHGVSILIPARNEAAVIERAVRGALANVGVPIEVIVLDDNSSDDTLRIVERLAAGDARLRVVRAPPLPPGWAGKQRACHLLAEQARQPVLMFVDADVRLAPQAAAAAGACLWRDPQLGLVSGFPRERTVGVAEQVVIPWIHVLLLGYLPMWRMQRSPSPAYAAACGQWIVARRSAYAQVGGHAAARASRHDGTSLPRTFRAAGWRTDVFDGSALAECRMYRDFASVWHGFAKSAGEGMATTVALPVWTLLLAGGHVLPWALLPTAVALGRPDVALLAAAGIAANVVLRALLCLRFGQSALGACLHPLGAALVLLNQWSALIGYGLGRPREWRGRHYARRVDV